MVPLSAVDLNPWISEWFQTQIKTSRHYLECRTNNRKARRIMGSPSEMEMITRTLRLSEPGSTTADTNGCNLFKKKNIYRTISPTSHTHSVTPSTPLRRSDTYGHLPRPHPHSVGGGGIGVGHRMQQPVSDVGGCFLLEQSAGYHVQTGLPLVPLKVCLLICEYTAGDYQYETMGLPFFFLFFFFYRWVNLPRCFSVTLLQTQQDILNTSLCD